jgi:hypothetical protein
MTGQPRLIDIAREAVTDEDVMAAGWSIDAARSRGVGRLGVGTSDAGD